MTEDVTVEQVVEDLEVSVARFTEFLDAPEGVNLIDFAIDLITELRTKVASYEEASEVAKEAVNPTDPEESDEVVPAPAE